MIRDPLLRGSGLCPYDALEAVGVDPDTPTSAILEASFELMARGRMTPEVRRAWDQLRHPDRRLTVDFLLYDVDLDAELARLRAALDETERSDEDAG
jgi:hypothetical protein